MAENLDQLEALASQSRFSRRKRSEVVPEWAKALDGGSKKRKLVSLFEANEVARRLTTQEAGKKRRVEEYGQLYQADEGREEGIDVLRSWYGSYVGWDEVEPQAMI